MVCPLKGRKSGKGESKESTACQREPYLLVRGCPVALKIYVQGADAVRVYGVSKEFILDVPLAGIKFVGRSIARVPLSHVQSEWIVSRFAASTETFNMTGRLLLRHASTKLRRFLGLRKMVDSSESSFRIGKHGSILIAHVGHLECVEVRQVGIF